MKKLLTTLAMACGLAATVLAENIITLDDLTRNTTITRDTTLTGTLPENVRWKISVADGVTVTLENASLHGDWSHDPKHEDDDWAALTCLGDATIVLVGDNSVKGYGGSPAIYVLTQPIVNVDDAFVFTIVASDNPDGVGAVVEHQLDPSGETVIGETPADKRFFRLKATLAK